MNKKIEIQVPEGKVAEWQEINGVTTLVLVDEADKRPVTERIKTFEDAVLATGMTLPFDDSQLSYLPKDVFAYMKLGIIAAALNGLTKDTIDEFPKFTDDEYRHYPWFYLYTQEEIDKMDEEKKKKLLAKTIIDQEIFQKGLSDFGTTYDEYLYQLKISADALKETVLNDLASINLMGFVPEVEVLLLQGTEQDIALINIDLTSYNEQYTKTYKIE